MSEQSLYSIYQLLLCVAYVEIIDSDLRFIELQGNGLMNFWGNLRFDVPRKCQKKNDRENSRASKTRRLSLQDLTGGFIVLFAGYGMSFATFLIEKVMKSSHLATQRKLILGITAIL